MHGQNRALLLSLVEAEGGKVEEVTALHNKVFNLQYNEKRIKTGFNYIFIKWGNGPFSPELEEDIDELIKLGYLKQPKRDITDFILTEKGKHQAQLTRTKKINWVERIRNLRNTKRHFNADKLLAQIELGEVINEPHFNYLCLDEAL